MIDKGDIERIRQNWRRAYPSDRSGRGIVCPICGSGSGKHGTGITEVKGEIGLLKCLNCGFAGDVIQLYCREHGLDNKRDFTEACEALAATTGLTLKGEYTDRVTKKASVGSLGEKRRNARSLGSNVVETDATRNQNGEGGAEVEQNEKGDLFGYLGFRGLSTETQTYFNVQKNERWRHPKRKRGEYKPVVIIPTSEESYLARDVRADDAIPELERERKKEKVGKVHIFNERALSEHETIIAVEGEIDAMSVFEAGFKNVVGIGSISYRQIFMRALRAANPRPKCIILSLDNEEKESVKAAFADFKKDITALGLAFVDGRSLSAPEKDANDLLVADRARLVENINSLLEQASNPEPRGRREQSSAKQHTARETIASSPLNLIIPAGCEFSSRGIAVEDKVASLTPVLPVKIITVKHDEAVKYVLAAFIDERWKEIEVDAAVIADNSKVLALAGHGVQVFTETAKYLVRFLNLTIAENRADIPRTVEYAQPGWYDELSTFALPRFRNAHMPALESMLTVRGDLDTWLDMARTVRILPCPIARIMLDVSFAAPLLAILDARGFTTYLWGDSLAGKSACQKFALSVWGNPDKMMTTFNGTLNGFEAAAIRSNNLPLMIDEKQVASRSFDFGRLPYMLSGESTRTRMDKTLKSRPTVNWRGTIMASGEDKLLEVSTEKGAYNRTFEIHLDARENIFSEPDAAGNLHRFVKRCHGSAGRAYVEFLLEEARTSFKRVRYIHEQMFERLRAKCERYSTEHVSNAALVAAADYLSSLALFGAAPGSTEEELAAWELEAQRGALICANYLLDKQPPAATLNDASRAATEVLAWISSYRHHFFGDHLQPVGGKEIAIKDPVLGTIRWNEDNEHGRYVERISVIASRLKDFLREKDFPVEKVIRDFYASGFLLETKTPPRERYNISGKLKRPHVAVIPREYAANIFDET